MDRICRFCGSEDIKELGWRHRSVYETGESMDVLIIGCMRCGKKSQYGENEKPKFNDRLLRRAIALDITL